MKIVEIVVLSLWVAICCTFFWMWLWDKIKKSQTIETVARSTSTQPIQLLGTISPGEWRATDIRVDENGVVRGPLDRPLNDSEIMQLALQRYRPNIDPAIAAAIDQIAVEATKRQSKASDKGKGKGSSKFNMGDE